MSRLRPASAPPMQLYAGLRSDGVWPLLLDISRQRFEMIAFAPRVFAA